MRGTHDGTVRGGGTHITEKWMPMDKSVVAMSQIFFSQDTGKMTLEWVEPDR